MLRDSRCSFNVRSSRRAVDEDVHGLIADTLRLRGRDVLRTNEAGRSGATDSQQLDFAMSQRRVFVSYNITDFPRMHHERLAAGEHHAGGQ